LTAMASTYALPVAAMPHSHNHIHPHSHSHSPSFSSSMLGPGGQRAAHGSRTVRQERSTGGLHAYTRSESHYGHGHSHAYSYDHPQANPNIAPHLHNKSLMSGGGYSEERTHDTMQPYPESNGRDPSLRMGNSLLDDRYKPGFHVNDSCPRHPDHGHSHHNSRHHDHSYHEELHGEHHGSESLGDGPAPSHGHSHNKIEARSRLTRMVLPYTESWPLLHSIMKEKDSRRIFYFMRCVTSWCGSYNITDI
jgi:solute carrier family 30 (zinc transporter), member 5/7